MVLFQEECDDEAQQLTLKEIEEQKRKEKEQQQKKVLSMKFVCDFKLLNFFLRLNYKVGGRNSKA